MRFQDFLILLETLDPELRRNRKEMIKHFNNLTKYSKWNAEHSMSVAKIARDFGKFLGLDHNKIVQSALTHDVGKIHIPKDVLHHPGKLDYDQRQTMNTHAISSKNLLNSITGDHGYLARLGAAYHHTTPEELEHLQQNGTLSETDVELIKVITIADIFDALSGVERPYKKTMSKKDALELMDNLSIVDKELFEKFKEWQLRDFANEYRN